MRFRKLRIAWSVGCGIACVLLIALWVRSYWKFDSVTVFLPTDCCVAGFTIDGVLQLAEFRNITSPRWKFVPISGNAEDALRPRFEYLGFDFSRNAGGYAIHLPFWFAILIVVCCGYSPWLPWSKRFSLRTLLIATTLVAAVLGLIVAALR